jgi:hypothetical protein
MFRYRNNVPCVTDGSVCRAAALLATGIAALTFRNDARALQREIIESIFRRLEGECRNQNCINFHLNLVYSVDGIDRRTSGPLPYMISGKLYTTLTMYLGAYFIT